MSSVENCDISNIFIYLYTKDYYFDQDFLKFQSFVSYTHKMTLHDGQLQAAVGFVIKSLLTAGRLFESVFFSFVQDFFFSALQATSQDRGHVENVANNPVPLI